MTRVDFKKLNLASPTGISDVPTKEWAGRTNTTIDLLMRNINVEFNNPGLILSISSQGSGSIALDGTQCTVLLDGSAGTATATLDASPTVGQVYNIKCTDDTNTCTVARNGNNIDGVASDITLIQDESITVHSDGTDWWII